MGIINRTKDNSEKRLSLHFSFANLSLTSGETGVLIHVPFPCNLDVGNISTFSVTGSPNLIFNLSRFIPGAGMTTWNIGSTFPLVSFGTSGVLPSGVSLPPIGSTMTKLMPNDVIGYQVGGGATAACSGVAGCFVVFALQDEKKYLGGLI